MKVQCNLLRSPATGKILESSPWLTIGKEYVVISIVSGLAGKVMLHLVTDDGSFGFFDVDCFLTTDQSIPSNWVGQIDDHGDLELAPASWLEMGFWESYYDDDVAAQATVNTELAVMMKGT